MNNKWSRMYWVDLGERVGSTFLGALAGAIALTGSDKIDWSDWQIVWTVLGVPTAFSLIKGLTANLASPDSGPSLLPSPPAPPVED